ncbi:Phytanoyl-CoA dioxygenase [Gracilaria domingensis]|nr:Phytanoyl-CoA dioxygenase [Gracilaria domingensis]
MLDAIPVIEEGRMQNPLYDSLSFRIWDYHPLFKQVATSSPVAAAAAQLTPVDTSSHRSLVVLKDAYFRMQGSNKGCGFHVDDPFFWPCAVDAPGPGVNAWIALHDVTEDGGGLTVAPASHGPSFVDCREAIKTNTCMLAELAPEKNARLEKIAVSPILKAGDVILHTRWLFHRGNPFKIGSKGESGIGISRYSIRYMPGESVVNEIAREDGQFVVRPGVVLREADADNFPAVSLPG